MTTFKDVRVASWEALRSKAWADDYPLYCAMQDRHDDVHVGVYCNALSHLEALEEFLYHASWCDDITLEGIQDDEPASERLLRFYGTGFLLMAECYEDLKDIAHTSGVTSWTSPFDPVNGFINTVVKHRRGPAGGFHISNHHGPYFFEDDPSHSAVLPTNFTSVGNYGGLKAGLVTPLLVPSLASSAGTLADTVFSMSSVTDSVEVISKIETLYGRQLGEGSA
jgi:hypothetical protein